MAQKFLEKIIEELLSEDKDLGRLTIIIPGKRPAVFFKQILARRKYEGLLPAFSTIEDLITEISAKVPIKGVALWLRSYDVYRSLYPSEDFSQFLKWFPTVQKDWDDVMKFSEQDTEVLEYLYDEEKIKAWAENLDPENHKIPRNKYLNFWRKMHRFLPFLKKSLSSENLATSGMMHEMCKIKIEKFAEETDEYFIFCGFNAFTPVEERLVRALLQRDKARCFFHADRYYIEDERQEAGQFLRKYQTWKEFNKSRDFLWTDDDFSKHKNINVYEVPGNVTQTKILPQIIGNKDLAEDTALILLDENLLPAALDSLEGVGKLNITMGFGLKNLSFSNAVKHLFYLQKNLEKNPNSYYYRDLLPVLKEFPLTPQEETIIDDFLAMLEDRNIVYISKKMLESLRELSFYQLLQKPESAAEFLRQLSDFCFELKFRDLDDIRYENVSYFEKAFKIIKNHTDRYRFSIDMETLEILINQIIGAETIDFQGEPLEGLQVMGLLETRLLNFKNIILLSVNEGKLPLGNSQNSYLPFHVRANFGMHTFLDNDGIYAYHFYRLLQGAENIHLMYNSLTSGVNTGEESRFIKQIEIESGHKITRILADNKAEAPQNEPMTIEKSGAVLEKLAHWKERISASALTEYLYNPINFYLNKILSSKEIKEIDEELSVRNYGILVHDALHILYQKIVGRVLNEGDIESCIQASAEAIDLAIEKLRHLPEFYERGMNFIHKSIAERVVREVLNYDLALVKNGHALEILGLEKRFGDIEFEIADGETVKFTGVMDRIDRLDGVIRIIDYKTAKVSSLTISADEEKRDRLLLADDKKQALQLCIYKYVAEKMSEFSAREIMPAIWSFANVKSGPVALEITKGSLGDAMVSVKNLILEILNPSVPFVERIKPH